MNLRSILPAALILAASAPAAHATLINAAFTGTVASQVGTTATVGSTVSGSFVYDTNSSALTQFTIAGVSAAGTLTSSTSFSAGKLGAFYTLGSSAVSTGGTTNNSYTLDLESLNTAFADANPVALLTDSAALAGNLDLAATDPGTVSPSQFSYRLENANGANLREVTANLTTLAVGVPEPASMALLGAAVFGLGALRRRRA